MNERKEDAYMWIEETKNGKYKFVEQYTDYMTGKRKRVSVTLDKKTAAAKRTAIEALTRMIEQRQNVVPEEKELTFSELVDKYREYQKLSVKAATYTRNYYACETLNVIQHIKHCLFRHIKIGLL